MRSMYAQANYSAGMSNVFFKFSELGCLVDTRITPKMYSKEVENRYYAQNVHMGRGPPAPEQQMWTIQTDLLLDSGLWHQLEQLKIPSGQGSLKGRQWVG